MEYILFLDNKAVVFVIQVSEEELNLNDRSGTPRFAMAHRG